MRRMDSTFIFCLGLRKKADLVARNDYGKSMMSGVIVSWLQLSFSGGINYRGGEGHGNAGEGQSLCGIDSGLFT